MLSKKVILAKAADARRNTSPQDAVSHNSERKKKDVTYQTAGVLLIHRNIQNASKANHKIYD